MTTDDLVVPEWVDLPAVPESRLGDELPLRLVDGEGGPPAPTPWSTEVSAVLWWHRAAPDAADLLPEAVRGLPTLPITVGALVRYRSTPVGPYSEVFASPVLLRPRHGRARPGRPRGPGLLPAVSVPFIAVDSIASVVGGRAGWMLPKTLATAVWPPDGPAVLRGNDWSVSVGVHQVGPRLPLRGRLPLVQPQPDGGRARSLVRMSGRAQIGRAEVSTVGTTLPSWLKPGGHLCLAISGGRMDISAPARL